MDRTTVFFLDRLAAPHTLAAAFASVARGGGMAGPDGEGIPEFAANLDENLLALRRTLVDGSYLPGPALKVPRRDDKRPIVVPAVRDRVVQRAIADLLGPRVEALLHDAAHAYRPGRSPHTAIDAIAGILGEPAMAWVARADVAKFFDRIDRGRMIREVGRVVSDPRALELVRKLLAAGQLDGVRIVDTEVGIAQGSPLSPLLSNLYLAEFDKAMAALEGTRLVRYSDDFCLFGADQTAVREALDCAERFLQQLGLQLNPDKTRLLPVAGGFEFVGFAVTPGEAVPPQRAIEALASRLGGADADAQRRSWLGFAAFYGPPDGWAPRLVELLAENGRSAESHAARRLSCDPDLAISEEPGGGSSDLARRDRERRAALAFAKQLGDDDLELFVDLFRGREAQVAVERIDERGQRRFVERDQALSAHMVRKHVAGELVVGSLVFRADGLVRWLCLDVDVCRDQLSPDGLAPEAAVARARDDALMLVQVLIRAGMYPLLEDSGHKGCHVWVRFLRPIPAGLALQLAAHAQDAAGPPPAGVRREVFPDRTTLRPGKSSPLVKLPWGIHSKTGRRCLLLTGDGQAAPDQLACLRQWQASDPEKIKTLAVPAPGAHEPVPTPELDLGQLPLCLRVLQGCAVLGHVAAKVEATRYLDHRERLLVAFTLGHLGAESRPAIHALVRPTPNYQAAVTDRYIDRNPPSPISCARIRERYPEITRQVPCDCSFRIPHGAYPTPVLHALRPSQVPGLHARDETKPKVAHQVVQPSPPVATPAVAASPVVQLPTPLPTQPLIVAATTNTDPVLQSLLDWRHSRKAMLQAEATLLALFGDRDRIDCELGVLVREPDGAGGWRFRIEVEP